MKSIQCERCMGTGWVPHESEKDRVDCPDCDGDGWLTEPDRFERLVGVDRAQRLRRPIWRTKRRLDAARSLWRDRNATTVAAAVEVNQGVLANEPRFRYVIDNDLRQKLEAITPLGWRIYDVRWCWANMKRAIRGQSMADLLYRENIELSVRTESRDFFMRNAAVVLAERRRIPRGDE